MLYGREIFKMNTLRKVFDSLNDYKLKRQNIGRLKEISEELQAIR